jgi:hypothetical protein
MKGGENLGDEESSEEEKEVTRLDSSAGSKATCFRRYFVLILVSRDTLTSAKSAARAWQWSLAGQDA